MSAATVDGWNVAHLNGGLLLSADDFMVQFNKAQVDKLIVALNDATDTRIFDNAGDVIIVHPEKDHVVLTRVNDKTYPNGIILPVSVFSDFTGQPVQEGHHRYTRVGARIVREAVHYGNKNAKAIFVEAISHLPGRCTIRRLGTK